MIELCECCNEIIPTFENFTKEKEETVRQTYREYGPISAIKQLREITGCVLKEANNWIYHCGEYCHRKTIPCPYCGELLRTENAKQCRQCKRDWHDDNNLTYLN